MSAPLQAAFDLIMDAMKRIQDLDKMDDIEFRRYMDTARALIPLINEEREGR